jgi:NAD(P)-dependent dehydrogenase (short-subunit alcohol dehydrogenase family)
MGEPRQEPPGTLEAMRTKPDHGEGSYRGSGRLEGKKAIITGGDSGIGPAVAIAFAREGADVLIAYLSEDDDAQDTAKYIEDAGRRCVLVSGDLAQREQCQAVVGKAVEEFGQIDILVNNAAYQMTHETLGEITDEEWTRTFDINITAMFRLIQAALPYMGPGAAPSSTPAPSTPTCRARPFCRTRRRRVRSRTSPPDSRRCSGERASGSTAWHPALSGHR